MAVGLVGEARVSMAHDALDNRVRNLRLQQQRGSRVTQPMEPNVARNRFGPERQAAARASLGEGLGLLFAIGALPGSTVQDVLFEQACTNEGPLHDRLQVEVRGAPVSLLRLGRGSRIGVTHRLYEIGHPLPPRALPDGGPQARKAAALACSCHR